MNAHPINQYSVCIIHVTSYSLVYIHALAVTVFTYENCQVLYICCLNSVFEWCSHSSYDTFCKLFGCVLFVGSVRCYPQNLRNATCDDFLSLCIKARNTTFLLSSDLKVLKFCLHHCIAPTNQLLCHYSFHNNCLQM